MNPGNVTAGALCLIALGGIAGLPNPGKPFDLDALIWGLSGGIVLAILFVVSVVIFNFRRSERRSRTADKSE